MTILPPELMGPTYEILKDVFINRSAHYIDSLFKLFKNRQEVEKNIDYPMIILKHRRYFREKFLFNALQEPNKILFVTIMSKHTINEIKSMVSEGSFKVKELRVLTLRHRTEIDQISEALSIHLNERPTQSVLSQINTAWDEWKTFHDIQPKKIKLRGYNSIPTMQGFVVKDQYALIELLTFNSNPNERAAILAKKDRNPELFQLFSSSFEKLWIENA